MGRVGSVLRDRIQCGGRPLSRLLPSRDGSGVALAGIGTVALWSLYASGGVMALLAPITLIATALWQGYIVDGYLAGFLQSVRNGWSRPW